MEKNVRIKKQVFVKKDFDKVVDRSFKSFVDSVEEEQLTVEQFFILYDELFFEIPVLGETASHQHLIERSSTLLEVEQDNQDIQPLLDEIAVLREQILELQTQLVEGNTPEQ